MDFNKYCETVQVPLLLLTEQKKIAEILDLIQSSILQQQKIIDTVQQLKKNLLHKLFTEGINNEPQKETEIGLMPKSWEVKELNEIPEKFIGGGTPSTSIAEYWNGDYWWTTSKRLDEEKIYLEEGEKKVTLEGINNSSTNLIPKGNLIISTRVTVGKAAINKFDIAISQDLTALIIDPAKYNIPFLAYQIKTSRIQDIFHSQKRGATIKGIPREDLKAMKFAIPSREEQNEIANALISIDNKIELHQRKKQTLEALFKSMLHQLMTGEIRVNNLELSKATEYKLENETLTLAAEP